MNQNPNQYLELTESELTCEERLEAANERILELEQALRKEIQFRTAKDLRNDSTQIWLPVMNVIDIFHKAYLIRNHALANNKSSTKLIFTVSNEGKVIDVSNQEPQEDRT